METPYSLRIAVLLFAVPLAVLTSNGIGAQESITFDPQTGNYAIAYKGLNESGQEVERQVVFVPATKIDPAVRSKIKQTEKGLLYNYKLSNGKGGQQALVSFNVGSVPDVLDVISPSGWYKTVGPDVQQGTGYRIGWVFKSRGDLGGGVVPGSHGVEFSVVSASLPGVGIARFRGATPIQGYVDEGPRGEFGRQVAELEHPERNSVPRTAAIPKIPAGQPFDPVLTLTEIQKHLAQDLVSMKLVDPVFASQLDRGLQAAISAAKLNSTKALRDHLKDLRHALKKEYDDVDKEDDDKDEHGDDRVKKSRLIDKLAAKVLDFDFKYVEQRL